MRRAVLALDQGTTSSRALVVDELGEVVSLAQRPLETSFPRPGWVEQDPELIWRTQLESGREALAAAQGRVEVVAIGLANQRETTILWHRETGEPIGQAIGWQDRRTAEFCGRLREDPGHERLTDLTGLIADSYFSATKIAWMLDHVPDARELALQGKLAFGTVDSFLIHRLSGQHLTDATNASRTLLLNLRNLEWSSELLELFGIPSKVLPEIVPSSGRVAVCRSHHFGQALPICGVAGDQ